MKRVACLILAALLLLSTTGCGLGVLVAGIGYASSSGKEADAKKAEVRRKYAESYNTYKIEMEKINLDREKSGLAASNIQTFDEWMTAQGVPDQDRKAIVADVKREG